MIKFYPKNTFLINFLFQRQASLPLPNYTTLALSMDVWEKALTSSALLPSQTLEPTRYSQGKGIRATIK